jgi:hypothetical protein
MKKLIHWVILVLILLLLTIIIQKKCYPCEMLCLARTDLQADSFWETNDIVVIKDNNWSWGSDERNKNLFFIVKIPDLSVSEARTKYMNPRLDTNGKMVANREYKIDTTKITIDKGLATTDKATLAGQVIKKAVAVAIEP